MTCIVGLVDNGRVWIGGDSAGVNGYLSMAVRTDRKVFRNGDFVMGFTSSFRMGQILAYSFNPPKPRRGVDIMAYMVTDFVDAARAALKSGGFVKTKEGAEEGGTFLVGFECRLFAVQGDFQVAESTHGYDACGCAADIALGSLYSTQQRGSPEERLQEALAAAEAFSAGVRGPIHIVSTNPLVPGAAP